MRKTAKSVKTKDKGTVKRTKMPKILEEHTQNKDFSKPNSIFLHMAPAKITAVYESYWRFAAERQEIFFKRLEGQDGPWSNQSVFQTFKFTNAYRASDRVSQYLIRNVIYRDDLPKDSTEVFFRIMIFKLFNKIETWELLENSLGPILYSDYKYQKYDQILTNAMERGTTIYSAAYIMPSAKFNHTYKHQNHLRLIEHMINTHIPKRLEDSKSMQEGFELLRNCPSIGDFLAYQFITDINYSEITNFSEMDFVIPGPGAKDGIRKCFSSLGGLNEPEMIRLMADIQEREFERYDIEFASLYGRPLQLIDCQNIFCEVDKYARVMHPDIIGVSGRTRIKQKFRPKQSLVKYWYPPKWQINDKLGTKVMTSKKKKCYNN